MYQVQSYLLLSIVSYDVSKHCAGSKVSDRCPLCYLFVVHVAAHACVCACRPLCVYLSVCAHIYMYEYMYACVNVRIMRANDAHAFVYPSACLYVYAFKYSSKVNVSFSNYHDFGFNSN